RRSEMWRLLEADGQALPGCGHAERALQASWWQEHGAADAGGPRAQQASKLETRLLLSRSEGGTVARAGGNTCAPLSAHVGSLVGNRTLSRHRRMTESDPSGIAAIEITVDLMSLNPSLVTHRDAIGQRYAATLCRNVMPQTQVSHISCPRTPTQVMLILQRSKCS